MPICLECNGTGQIECPACGGYGSVLKDKQYTICSRCKGIGRVRCPSCVEKLDTELIQSEARDLYNIIRKKLAALNEFDEETKDKLETIFRLIYLDDELGAKLKTAQKECERRSINRHDILHALTVCNNSISLFNFLCLKPSLRQPYLIPHLERDLSSEINDPREIESKTAYFRAISLAAIIIASYFHDWARAYKNHPEYGSLLYNILEGKIQTFITDTVIKRIFTDMVAKCIETHEGSSKVYTLEESIVILSDGFDCDSKRVQPSFDILTVFIKDPSPQDYFSCKDIPSCNLILSATGPPIKFQFVIHGYGAINPIVQFKKRLMNTIFNENGNRDLVEITVKNEVWDFYRWNSPELRIWPSVAWI